jgi:hypothetical protein
VYDVAPDADIVNDLPAQIEPLFTETTGLAFTETEFTADAEHPVVEVATTEYVVFVVGETTILDVVAPFDQLYVTPPSAGPAYFKMIIPEPPAPETGPA